MLLKMKDSPHTRLAVLGTVSDLHRQPIAYDLSCLQRIIAEVSPDLLCAEITVKDWEREDLTEASVEVREALAPVIASTDIVLIPVAPSPQRYSNFAPRSGWRRGIVEAFDRLLRWGQLRAGTAHNINGPWFGVFCHTVCWLTEHLWNSQERSAWEEQNQELAANVVQALERDPGRRVLLAVQCQRLHQLIPLLHMHRDQFTLVSYPEL